MNPLLILLAILPGLLICYFIFRMDKYESEPKIPLAICFLLGIAVTFPALKLEEWVLYSESGDYTNFVETFLYALIGVSLIEEGIKFLTLTLYPFQNKFFNEPMDGIVFSVMIAMGFATFENVMYAGRFGLEITLARAITAVPAHATFAIIMGYYVGLAKFNEEKKGNLLATGLLLAMLFHAVYDFFLIQEMYDRLTIFSIFVLIIAVLFARKMIKLHQENSPFKDPENV